MGWSYPLSTLNPRIAEGEGKPLAPWSLHDVRRTVRSGLARLGIRPDGAERVLGHSRASTVEAVYDCYSYRPELAAALARWSNHVLAVIEDQQPKIVTLRERTA
jgi:integrase